MQSGAEHNRRREQVAQISAQVAELTERAEQLQRQVPAAVVAADSGAAGAGGTVCADGIKEIRNKGTGCAQSVPFLKERFIFFVRCRRQCAPRNHLPVGW